MKTILASVLICAVWALPAAADLFVVEAPVAKVYSEPALTAPVKGQAVCDEICAVVATDWVFVILPDGLTGWVRAQDGRMLSARPAPVLPVAAETATVMPVAEMPAVDAALYEEARRAIIRFLPNHPEARPLTVADLALWAGEGEQQAARANNNRYVMRGDCNGNGRQELVIAGLLSPRPQPGGGFRAFLLVTEEQADGRQVRLFFNLNPVLKRGVTENLFLMGGGDGSISIGFANNSGYMSVLRWNGREYVADADAGN